MTSELHPVSAVQSTGSVDSLPDTSLTDVAHSIDLSAFPQRFQRHVRIDASSGCWIWTGWLASNFYYPKHKYGYLKYPIGDGKRRSMSAHRFAYSYLYGAVPKGIDVDHLCHNKLCVNPAHLEAVTHKENIRRRLIPDDPRINIPFQLKTRCIRGHTFTPENIYIAPDGHRRCRACNEIRAQARRKAARHA